MPSFYHLYICQQKITQPGHLAGEVERFSTSDKFGEHINKWFEYQESKVLIKLSGERARKSQENLNKKFLYFTVDFSLPLLPLKYVELHEG